MKANQQDLQFQPETKDYSYKETAIGKRRRKMIGSFLLGIALFTALFLIFIFLLHFFRFIYLDNYFKPLELLPRLNYELTDIINNKIEDIKKDDQINKVREVSKNNFAVQGKIADISKDKINVKLDDGTLLSLYITTETKFYLQTDKGTRSVVSESDFIKKETKEKEVLVEFRKENLKNILTSIEMIN